jgi:hypothetical protein
MGEDGAIIRLLIFVGFSFQFANITLKNYYKDDILNKNKTIRSKNVSERTLACIDSLVILIINCHPRKGFQCILTVYY